MSGMDKNDSVIRNPNSSLPQGWQWVRLGEILELHDNGLWGSHDPVSGIPVIRSVNFCNDGSISTEDIARIQPSTQNTQNKRLRKGDILLERSGGGPKQPVGRVVLFDLDEKFYFGNFISRLRCKPDVDSSFLFFQLFNIHMKGGTLLLQDQTTGIRNLRFTEYLQLPIALSSLPEQKWIAVKVQELMAEVERARAACEAQLEAAKALPSAYLRQVFESEEAKNWERRRLGEVVLPLKNGIVAEQNFEAKGFKVTRIETISNGIIDPEKIGYVNVPIKGLEDFSLQYGDILFSHINSVEKLGNCAIYDGIPEDLFHGMNLMRIRANASLFDPYFLLFWLRSDECKSYYVMYARRAIGQASLNQADLNCIPIPLPAHSIQNRLVSELKERMTQAEKLKESIENQLEAIYAVPQAILKKAFSGEM